MELYDYLTQADCGEIVAAAVAQIEPHLAKLKPQAAREWLLSKEWSTDGEETQSPWQFSKISPELWSAPQISIYFDETDHPAIIAAHVRTIAKVALVESMTFEDVIEAFSFGSNRCKTEPPLQTIKGRLLPSQIRPPLELDAP